MSYQFLLNGNINSTRYIIHLVKMCVLLSIDSLLHCSMQGLNKRFISDCLSRTFFLHYETINQKYTQICRATTIPKNMSWLYLLCYQMHECDSSICRIPRFWTTMNPKYVSNMKHFSIECVADMMGPINSYFYDKIRIQLRPIYLNRS